jgi:peptidoglycan L-alanyl-D-glutamate endopeptidase CwlK
MKDGKANSEAIDFAPWVEGSIPWDDTHVFAIIAGCFHAAAKEKNAVIRYGGDWDTDGSTKDQTLMDWGHVEIIL